MANSEPDIELELLGYEAIENDGDWFAPVGRALVQSKHGITTNLHEFDVLTVDLGDDGAPKIEKLYQQAIGNPDPTLSSQISDSFQNLIDTGWISSSAQLKKSFDSYQNEYLEIVDWQYGMRAYEFHEYTYGDWGIDRLNNSQANERFRFLVEAIVSQEGAYSLIWYDALICRYYFLFDAEFPFRFAFEIGKLTEQKRLKFGFERDALNGIRDAENLNLTRKARAATAVDQERQKDRTLRMLAQQTVEHFIRKGDYKPWNNSSLAAEIRALLESGDLRDPEKHLKGNGENDWISERRLAERLSKIKFLK